MILMVRARSAALMPVVMPPRRPRSRENPCESFRVLLHHAVMPSVERSAAVGTQ